MFTHHCRLQFLRRIPDKERPYTDVFRSEEVCFSICAAFWIWYREQHRSKSTDDVRTTALLCIMYVLRCTITHPPPNSRARASKFISQSKSPARETMVGRLLQEHDFINLVEKAILAAAEHDDDRTSVLMFRLQSAVLPIEFAAHLRIPDHGLQYLKDLLSSCPRAIIRPLFRRDFLLVTDCLRTTTADSSSDHPRSILLQWWRTVAATHDITEEKLRAEMHVESRRAMGNLAATGCGWFKCVRYGDDCGEPFDAQCNGCQKYVYCGILCQTR